MGELLDVEGRGRWGERMGQSLGEEGPERKEEEERNGGDRDALHLYDVGEKLRLFLRDLRVRWSRLRLLLQAEVVRKRVEKNDGEVRERAVVGETLSDVCRLGAW